MLPPPHHCPLSTAKVLGALALAEFVFVSEDTSLHPLSQLYRGPYKVLARSGKFFTLWMGSRTDTVFIDCLKPVYGLTRFHSSLHDEVGLLVLFGLRSLVLLGLRILWCLLPPFVGILHNRQVLHPHLLYPYDDAGGEVL